MNAEFKRITTKQLTPVFMENLDKYTDTLMETFSGKGGAQGRKMKNILQVMENTQVPLPLVEITLTFLGILKDKTDKTSERYVLLTCHKYRDASFQAKA